MACYCKVILVGNLTRDPELRQAKSPIASFGVAINRKWRSESGEQKEEVTFVDVTAFGKQAETVAQYFRKGSSILIEGRLRTESWEKDGQKKSKLGVVLEQFSFLDKAEGGQATAARPAGKPAPNSPPTNGLEPKDDDGSSVPF